MCSHQEPILGSTSARPLPCPRHEASHLLRVLVCLGHFHCVPSLVHCRSHHWDGGMGYQWRKKNRFKIGSVVSVQEQHFPRHRHKWVVLAVSQRRQNFFFSLSFWKCPKIKKFTTTTKIETDLPGCSVKFRTRERTGGGCTMMRLRSIQDERTTKEMKYRIAAAAAPGSLTERQSGYELPSSQLKTIAYIGAGIGPIVMSLKDVSVGRKGRPLQEPLNETIHRLMRAVCSPWNIGSWMNKIIPSTAQLVNYTAATKKIPA